MADIPEYRPKADKSPRGFGRLQSGASTKRRRSPPRTNISVDQLREQLTEFFIQLGVMTMMRNETDGIIIIGGAPELVDAYCDLAEKNLWVRYVLEKLVTGSDITKCVTVTMSMGLAIASNHGAYNGPLFISPERYAAKADDIIDTSTKHSDDTNSNGATSPISIS